MRALVGCENCGFVTGTHGYLRDSSRACPECGKRLLQEMGPNEALSLIRERKRAESFRAQAAARSLRGGVSSRPSDEQQGRRPV